MDWCCVLLLGVIVAVSFSASAGGSTGLVTSGRQCDLYMSSRGVANIEVIWESNTGNVLMEGYSIGISEEMRPTFP